PSFVRSQLPALNNSLLPLVFSINCQSGNFIENDGFAEEFFKLSGKGAIGVFSHVATSYSGYNDALILGMIDAMFPFPGLNPIFTGTAAQPSVITPHAQLTKPGEIALQGLLRMTQTWGNLWNLEKRTFHLLHYFGDPSMEIMLYPPQTLQVNFFPYVTCHDSLLRVISSNADSITLVVTQNNKILKKLLLKQTDSIVAITPPIAGTPITIAAIKKGYIPHIQQFQVWGNCFKPQLRITGNYCIEEPMKFEVQPSSPFSYVSWNFGPNAISSHASGNGPHEVKFLDDGWHIIEANVQMRDSIYVLRDTIWIDETCPIRASMGKRVIYQCNGTFQTNDTFHFYKPLVTDTLIVISPGASMMQIFALRFQVAAGDTLFIFRFSGNAPFLIDKFYEGKSLSFLQVTGDRFMLIWKSDPSLQGDGIELRWECTPAQLPPIAAAEIVDFDPCSGTIILKDTSRNQPEQITWFFSDGSTYHLPVVVHQFQDTGCYQVSLVVSNNYGNDTLLISPFCLQPLTPPVFSTYFLCQPDFLHFISQDTLLWYVSSFVEHPLKVDTSFTFWYNGQEKVMVRKFRKKDLILAGKQDTSGMGSYINSSFEQRLFFEVLKPIYFESFDVYSMIAQQGRFFLLSSSGDTIWKAALTLVAGKNTIAVKRYLTPGEPYSLVIAPNVILFKNYFSQAFYPAYYENLVKLSGSNSLDGGLFDYPGLYRWRLWDLCLSGFDTIHVNLNFTSLPEEKKYYFCQGDSVRLFSQDTTPVLWMPHLILGSYLDVYNTGTYYAIIEDSSCVNQSSVFEITFLPPAEQVGIIYQQQGLTFTFTPTHSGLVYEWDLGDGTISYLENIVHTYSDSMERTVTLTTYSPCGIAQVDTLIFHHEVITSPSIESENILIYPNPVADFLHIKASEPLNKIEIYTVSGEKLYVFNSDNVKESFFFFPMNLSAGVYYVHVTTHFHVYVACIVVTKK
ncbi:MAG: PKD domain-containing protein, partial [Bacteroidales bacterium]|nr:PKD domain-containing protein [Bacteroidales bacterium]